MSDRELLELAARAADYKVEFDFRGVAHIHNGSGPQSWEPWNPLEEDGDAFRLAVKLRITPSMASIDTSRQIYTQPPHLAPIFEPVGNDELAATRRAIVRAASEIGRNMKFSLRRA